MHAYSINHDDTVYRYEVRARNEIDKYGVPVWYTKINECAREIDDDGAGFTYERPVTATVGTEIRIGRHVNSLDPYRDLDNAVADRGWKTLSGRRWLYDPAAGDWYAPLAVPLTYPGLDTDTRALLVRIQARMDRPRAIEVRELDEVIKAAPVNLRRNPAILAAIMFGDHKTAPTRTGAR